MGATPLFAWPWPDLPITADGPDAFSDLALAVESTLTSKVTTSYVPTWTAATQNPASPATKVGWWRRSGEWVDMAVVITFGGTTNGGVGALHVGLPVLAAASPGQQVLSCRTYIPSAGGIFNGEATIGPGAVICTPQFALTLTSVMVGDWQNAAVSGVPGGGVPAVPGGYTVISGGNLVITGRYRAG